MMICFMMIGEVSVGFVDFVGFADFADFAEDGWVSG